MANCKFTVKMNPQTREDLRQFAQELGLSSSKVAIMLIKQAIRQQKILLSTEVNPKAAFERMFKLTDPYD